MIVTRRIEVFICEDDKALRKACHDKLYAQRDMAMKASNAMMSFMFTDSNTMPYLSDDDRAKITYLGCKGTPCSKQNALGYTVIAKLFPDLDKGMASCLAQAVYKVYTDDRKKGMWDRSLRSYKANLPMPFQAKAFHNFRFADYTNGAGETRTGCFFTLMGIPFQMRFGRDRSNNQAVVKAALSGEYKMCTSSIKVEGRKIYLLLCVDVPKREYAPIKGKTLHCYLGSASPILCSTEVEAKRDCDSGYKVWDIGGKEEFFDRRRAIQAAVRRCQVANRYAKGGRGRKKKCKAIGRWHEVENDYVDTKLHTYSRMLVDMAVKHRCSEIRLWEQEEREAEAKDAEPLVLRNWSYYGLKEKIAYKAKMFGIKLTQE